MPTDENPTPIPVEGSKVADYVAASRRQDMNAVAFTIGLDTDLGQAFNVVGSYEQTQILLVQMIRELRKLQTLQTPKGE